MPMKMCVLASSSAGNCTYVAAGRTALLVDAGLSGRETLRRLDQIGVAPESLQAVCVTHEHTDHTAGLAALQRRLGLRLYANSGTIEGIRARAEDNNGLSWHVFTTGSPFPVGDIIVEPFSVPHDAYDPVGFILSSGDTRIGIVTDMGTTTLLIRERLRRCQALIIEANHDEELLLEADRPWHLKQRILGRQGHLSNTHAAELIGEVAGADLRCVFLAHLSAECNHPDRAVRAVREALGRRGATHVRVEITSGQNVSPLWETP